MSGVDWLQLFIFVVILTILTKPLGLHLCKVLDPNGKTCLDWLLKPLEKYTYKICKIKVKEEQSWKEYLFSVLAFSFLSLIFTQVILQLQHVLPLNPQKFSGFAADLAFNTSTSFMTNTNWQNYGGENSVSCFSQMFALVVQNFVSPAVGLAGAAALTRGFARHSSHTVGNFWTDLVRICYYVLLPLAIIFAFFFISQGVPQNFAPYVQARGIEMQQMIPQGPIASQEAIKLLGTNGGGYMNANSAHPFENPTPLCNFLQILALILIPAAQTYYFGREVKHQKHGWALYIAMMLLLVAGLMICTHSEQRGDPLYAKLGVDALVGNMEGKEQRLGVFCSSFFATATTATSTGAVNAAHDSFTPIGGLIPMLNIQLGEVMFGGVGSGLYSMLLFVIYSIFMAGLMIGRIPEYLGKKIESYEVKMSMFALLAFIAVILGCTASACVSKWGLAGLGNRGPHGLSEMLYAFSSCAGNNGSAFAGLSGNTLWYNITLAIAMLVGRFLVLIPVLALAGSLAAKKKPPESAGDFPLSGATFILLLIGVIILLGALTFLPALILGPILEQFFMLQGKLF